METKSINLTNDEIQKLFRFVESKYVRYKDVQFEIVDHLASSIEEVQENDPTVNFDAALKDVYSKFPITGFTNFIASKSESLQKYWRKKLWKYFLEYFKLPKILLLFMLFGIFHVLFSTFQVHSFLIFVVITLLIIPLWYIQNRRNQIEKQREKYLVVESYGSAVYFIAYLSNYPLLIKDIVIDTTYEINVFSAYCAILLVLWNAIIFVFPEMLKEEIESNFAHLEIG